LQAASPNVHEVLIVWSPLTYYWSPWSVIPMSLRSSMARMLPLCGDRDRVRTT